MKEYFSHDYAAREDEKIKRLLFVHKWEGYGIYWGIIENLYQNNGFLILDYDSIAYDMRTHKETIDSIINSFDLFKFKENKFYSESVLRRLKERKNKSFKASESAKVRWNKCVKHNANALQTHNESNAIKEKKSKVKESKVKENKINIYRQFKHLKITIEENQKLLDLNYTQEQIDSILNDIENYKKNTNYTSLYLTANKWLKKEYPNNNQFGKLKMVY